MHKTSSGNSKAANALLDWYDRHARVLPWRIPPDQSRQGVLPDPYFIWLSEIMLQQTQVKTVIDYFLKFTKQWPRLQDLAEAEPDDVMKAWAGLGYYSRARNLKKCAEEIEEHHEGRFPELAEDLVKLPGIGPYTSAAIAAIAFQEAVPVVDGNVERVISRVHKLDQPVGQIKPGIKSLTADLLSQERPGDFAQATMDLGATLCTPKNPSCLLCPWQSLCGANLTGNPEHYPVKAPKKEIPQRVGAAFVLMDNDHKIFLRKRPGKGMLAGMSEPPSTNWSARKDGLTDASAAPIVADWNNPGLVRHRFTHFQLEMKVYYATIDESAKSDLQIDGWWSPRETIMDEALPNLMKKVIQQALEHMDAKNE